MRSLAAAICALAVAFSSAPGTGFCEHLAPNAGSISHHVRRISLEGAANFRDLGGYEINDGRTVRWGLLYRSDALNALTARDITTLNSLNIRRVVDFRVALEIARSPDSWPLGEGIVRENLPVTLDVPRPATGQILTDGELDRAAQGAWLEAIDLALTTEAYPRFVRDFTPAYRAWMQGLVEGPPGAQLFHCSGGADRTGFAAAMLLFALGVPKETVMRDYLLTNRYLFSPAGRRFLDKRTPFKLPAGLQMHARYLEAAFSEIEDEYGSIDAYLRDGLGIDDAARAKLRARYLE